MCRLFLSLHKHSNVSEHNILSFLQQSHHTQKNTPGINSISDHNNHMDGYGFAGFNEETDRWNIYKSVSVYHKDIDHNKFISRFIRYSFVIGHIRNSSNVKHIPLSQVNTYENTHPFYYRNQVFFHNGTIIGFHEKIDVLLAAIDSDLRKHIRGNTDTELVFYLFLSNIRKISKLKQDNPTVLRISLLNTLHFLQTHFDLFLFNIIYANKNYSLVTRYIYTLRPSTRKPPTLYWNIPASKHVGNTFERIGNKLLISSEPISEKQFLVPANTLIIIKNDTCEISVNSL